MVSGLLHKENGLTFRSALKVLVSFTLTGLFTVQGRAQLPPDSVRRTPMVNVIEGAEKSVVALFAFDKSSGKGTSGTGSIIHPLGYVLTNNHVLPTKDGQAVYQGKAVPFRVVGRMPEHDIAIVKLESKREWPTLSVGRNHDLMNGETVVTAGNPGGRGIVFTAGIISSKQLLSNTGNALAMTQFNSDGRSTVIQFDAATNRGSSGGPLLDLESRLIGIVSGSMPSEQNVNYAIPIDRVRSVAVAMIEPEIRHRKRIGISIAPDATECLVAEVTIDSVAAKHDIRPGDAIVSVNGLSTRHVLDWVLAIENALSIDGPLQVVVRNEKGERALSLIPDPYPVWPAMEPKSKPVPGLAFKLYNGLFEKLPEFLRMSMENEGMMEELSLASMTVEGRQGFAAQIESCLDIPGEGLYRLSLTSDDGSRLFMHDRPLIDNDYNHPPQTVSRLARLAKGLHPIRIDYYQGKSGAALQLQISLVDERTWEESPVPLKFLHGNR